MRQREREQLISEHFDWQDRRREFVLCSQERLNADDEKLSVVGKPQKKRKYDGQKWNGAME